MPATRPEKGEGIPALVLHFISFSFHAHRLLFHFVCMFFVMLFNFTARREAIEKDGVYVGGYGIRRAFKAVKRDGGYGKPDFCVMGTDLLTFCFRRQILAKTGSKP